MLCYIVCSCGLAIDDTYALFREIKHDMMKEEYEKGNIKDIAALDLPITTEGDQISLNPIFEMLGIENHCCKMKIMGVAEFAQLLK